MDNTYLAHYGVKGMRWGVRKDRSASNGIREFGKKAGHFIATKAKSAASSTAKGIKTVAANKKPKAFMTNEELQQRINRMKLEQSYKELVDKNSTMNKLIAKGKESIIKGLGDGIEKGSSALIVKAVDRFNNDKQEDRKTLSNDRQSQIKGKLNEKHKAEKEKRDNEKAQNEADQRRREADQRRREADQRRREAEHNRRVRDADYDMNNAARSAQRDRELAERRKRQQRNAERARRLQSVNPDTIWLD